MTRRARRRSIETRLNVSKSPADSSLPWRIEMIPIAQLKPRQTQRPHPPAQANSSAGEFNQALRNHQSRGCR